MAEKSNDPHFVGSADASISKSPETSQKEKFTLTSEQKQVADVMKESGEKFEKNVIDAREKAAGKLKELRGKELVDAGARQMGHGVLETVKAQLIGVPVFGLLGGIAGGLFGKEIDGSMPSGFMEPLKVIGGEFVGSDSDFSRINEVLGYEAFPTSSARSSSRGDSSVTTAGGAVGGGIFGMNVGAFLGFEMAGIDYNKKLRKRTFAQGRLV